MIVKTRNSTYEIDTLNKLARRVSGVNPVLPDFAPEGEWKPYAYLSPPNPIVGCSLNIVWPNENEFVRTSTVVAIEQEQGALAA